MITLKGTHNITVLHPEKPDQITGENIAKARFDSALKDEAGEQSVTGFVSGKDFLDEDPQSGMGIGSYMNWAWREDKKALNGSALRFALAQAVKKRGGKVSRKDRSEMKDQIRLSLLSSAPWVSSSTNIVFNPATGDLYIFEAPGKKLDSIVAALSGVCSTDFKRGETVQSLEDFFRAMLEGHRDTENGEWQISEDGKCSLFRESDDPQENASISVTNAGTIVKTALDEGFLVKGLSIRIDSTSDGATLCTFQPLLEPEGLGFTLKGLKVNLTDEEKDDSDGDDAEQATLEIFAKIVELVKPCFASSGK